MKRVVLFLLGVSLQCCLGQTDTNVLASGEWSEPVENGAGHALRGRLLVYDDQAPSAANHARVYLELQHVFHGGWSNPLEVYFDIGRGNDLHFDVRDEREQPVAQAPVAIRGPAPAPCWVTLPCDSTVRLRADMYTLGPPVKPDGLEILVGGGCWRLPASATNDFFLSATFSPSKDHPSPLRYYLWQGTLKLPKVRIAGKGEDAIDRLAVNLSASHGLWQNGVSPIIRLPTNAPVEQVISKVFEMTGFEKGHATSHRILKSRQVRVAGSLPDVYTAVLVKTDLGRKIVLLQPYNSPTDGWWSRVYDADTSK